jgi:hypothetical protein
MDNLIDQIDAFCALHGLSESQFGISALNDKNLVPQLRSGRDVRLSTVARIKDWMAGYSPPSSAAA